MCFFNDLFCLGGIKVFLVKSKSIERLVIGSLVPSEPFPNTVEDSSRNIIDVIVFLGKWIINGNGQYLPVEFTIVDHGKNAKGLDLRYGSHIERLGSDLHDIDWIVVSEYLKLWMFLIWVLPCLWEA